MMTATPEPPRPPSGGLPPGVRDLYKVAARMQQDDDSLILAAGLLLEQIAHLHAAAEPCPVCRAEGGAGACPLPVYADSVAYAYLMSLLDG
jgi:hypothetical protein